MAATTNSLQLEEALFRNLESRGVIEKLEGCLLALLCDYISETQPKPAPVTRIRRGPDDILCFALIADYLRDVAPSALSVFEVETGISSPSTFRLENKEDSTGFGPIVAASLAQKITKKSIVTVTAPLGGVSSSIPESSFHRNRMEPGVLERKVVEAELGLDEDADLDSSTTSESESPLLLLLIKRARERRIARATATGSWLSSVHENSQKGNKNVEDEDNAGDLPGSLPMRSRDKPSVKSSTYNAHSKQPILILN
jgi:hypothetical protein